MNVRERVSRGQGVRVLPLAKESGFPASTIYAQIASGKIAHARCGTSIVVTAEAARQLLGMPALSEEAAT